jgi:hypothetical protein
MKNREFEERPARPLKLAAVLQALKKHYGAPEPVPTKDPF